MGPTHLPYERAPVEMGAQKVSLRSNCIISQRDREREPTTIYAMLRISTTTLVHSGLERGYRTRPPAEKSVVALP